MAVRIAEISILPLHVAHVPGPLSVRLRPKASYVEVMMLPLTSVEVRTSPWPSYVLRVT